LLFTFTVMVELVINLYLEKWTLIFRYPVTTVIDPVTTVTEPVAIVIKPVNKVTK